MSSSKILDLIIKPEYKARYTDWERYAKKDQLIGLDCIGQIYNSKGTKKLKTALPSQKQMYDTHESFFAKPKLANTLEEAEENFRRKQITTSYQFYHGGYSVPKSQRSNVFRFKTLQELNLARPLTQMAISFVDNWIQMGDDKKYEQYVLACLRSLNSKLFLSDPHCTEMKTSYNWKKDWSLSKPVRMDKAGEDLYAFKPNWQAIKKQEARRQTHRAKMQELQKSDFAQQLKIFKDFKIN